PELIFIIFLPPLLFEAAFAASWKELWKLRRIVTNFAFVVVFLTAISVALVTNAIIPGFSLALGFVLGGIVSPPDAVSAQAILKIVKVQKNVATLLEGESLFNDASSLIIFRFAMVVVATGQFIWWEASLSFLWMVIGGVGIGLAIAYIFMKIHKIFPTDVNMDTILTIIAPYFMYIFAEEVHSSGVLSVVSGGLFLSVRRYDFLQSSQSRIMGANVWQGFAFLINGIVFLIIGLDLPEIMEGIIRYEGISLGDAFYYGMLVTFVLIVVRFLASYATVFVTLFMRKYIKVAEPNPHKKMPILIGWTGMRGVISLAMALSIPVYMDNGELFPHRDLILFITFVVILATLIIQGLTLPFLIKYLKLPRISNNDLSHEEAERILRNGMSEVAIEHLKKYNQNDCKKENVYIKNLLDRWEKEDNEGEVLQLKKRAKLVLLETLEKQREWLLKENRINPKMDEEVVRHYLLKLDLEEERLRM
ncbi:MAG: Na+/H+ antiporter, partial [Bergeyella zoohelcum]|nr:Na+/H+ antiporter [Bergeyella zoohelcum]